MKLRPHALKGSEPLAFLAALGTLRGAARRWPSARLAWKPPSPFEPELELPDDTTENDLLETLVAELRRTAELEFFSRLGSDVKVPPAMFRKLLKDLIERNDEQAQASLEFLAALGNEMISDRSGKKLKPTAWHMTAGQQQFLEMARILLRETTAEHVRAALFQPWRYSDSPPAMRWDTTGERLYALEARNPSTVQIRTVRGANTLAFLALPLFPVSAAAGRLRTRGFIRSEDNRDFFTWPIWSDARSVELTSLVVGDHRLAELPIPATSLTTDSILAVFRSERSVNDHGYGSLRPAEQVS